MSLKGAPKSNAQKGEAVYWATEAPISLDGENGKQITWSLDNDREYKDQKQAGYDKRTKLETDKAAYQKKKHLRNKQ